MTNPQPLWFREESVGSTNLVLRDKVRAGEVSHGVVWSQEQTAGRGRLGRSWLSPQGGLYLSLSTPVQGEVVPTFFGVVVGVEVARLLRRRYDVAVSLKWPNDLVVVDGEQERKVGGILAEYLPDAPSGPHVVVGVGLNANAEIALPEDDTALAPTSLGKETAAAIALEPLAHAVVEAVFERWRQLQEVPHHGAAVVSDWKELSCTLHRRVRVHTPKGVLVGIARDVTLELALLVEDDSGHTHEVHTGDCLHLRATG